MSEDRRRLHELAARYEIEPTLRDVYVEGQFDAVLVSWLLKKQGCDDAAVYEIDTVDIPPDILKKHGLDEGQKGRVIALCLELEASAKVPGQVTGVVDRDYDAVLGIQYRCPLLQLTDFSCMEMYAYNERVLQAFFHLYVRKAGYTAAAFMAGVQHVLREAFLMRCTNQKLGCGLTWLDVEDQCKLKRNSVEFNSEEFVRKYLNKSAQLPRLADFTKQLVEFRAAIADMDARHCINGHDFVGMLAKYVSRAVKNKSLADPDVVERQLAAHLDYEALAKEPLFQAIIARVRK
jgi:hypothetical protein